LGALHRVESVGAENLVVIEVQMVSTSERTTSNGSRTTTACGAGARRIRPKMK